MHTVAEIQAAITLLRLHNPDALRLGELVSFAARIEPELLRAVRLELTSFDAAAEADLWFSPLVETRTADWIALVPAAARELRSALVIDHTSLAAAHELIKRAHVSAPATIILEEEILWLPLSGRPDVAEAIDARLRLVLGKLLEDPRAHRGLAHWFAGAAQRLPEEAQATEAYALLYFVTSGLLDGRRISGPEPTLGTIDTLADALPVSIPKLHVWATLNDYGLTLRPKKVPGFVQLEIPGTDPLLFELRTLYEPHQFITLRRGETKTFQVRSGEVELRTAAGDTYRLRRPQKRTTGGLQNLIMGFGGTGAHILTALKELTVLKHGHVPDNIKFLLFDTIADWEPGKRVHILGEREEKLALGDDPLTSLDPRTEYFHLTDYDPDLKKHVYDFLSRRGKPEAFPHLKDWLHAQWFSQQVRESHLDIVNGAAQQRQIGRYAIFKNAEKIVAHLRGIIRSMAARGNDQDVGIWLIGSAAGGTGAGCLIDAAYLTRLAAEGTGVILDGVIVLPNVYSNMYGIRKGRAFSLLRELDRVQEQGIPLQDRYVDRSELVSSQVVYDKNSQQVARVRHGLFDELLYLGSDCFTEDERQKFFTSVASAIDPYLDSHSAPELLERKINDNSLVSAIGATRLQVPTATLAEMFAWEQVAEYLRRAGAPKEIGDRVAGLHVGSDSDRSFSAVEKFRNLLQLFKDLLDFDNWTTRASQVFARDGLDSQRIVNVWYELSGSSLTPAEQTVLLTYADPCYSLTQAERPNKSDWESKTYKENAAAGGRKETQEESRGRFADQLEQIRRRYTNPNGGERTFEKGRRYVIETVSEHLQKKADDIFIHELELRRRDFATTVDATEQGTALTRLFAEVGWILSDAGPLRRVHRVIDHFVGAVASEQAERDSSYTRALQELRESKKPGIFVFSSWVEAFQQAARDECSAYLYWYQKHELLKDMRQLVFALERRFREWERLILQLFEVLVLQDRGEASALSIVTQVHLRTLQDRLYRAARNRSTLICFGSEPDPQMHGYQDELRKHSANNLTANLLNDSHWEASLSADGMPTISLVINSPYLTQRYSLRDLRRLPNELYHFFYRRIDERLSYTDVFDYLLWLREHEGLDPDAIANRLDSQGTALINAGGVPEIRTLVYNDPLDSNKKDLADAITLRLHPLDSIVRHHSDRNSITLIKTKKPRMDQINEVEVCRLDYLALRAEPLNYNLAHDQELTRALVFHPFRQEAEAWYIERYYQKSVGSVEVPMLPPRIVRLLEDPEMMQIFVHSIATGAVEKIEYDWIWHGPEGDLFLTNSKFDGSVDIIGAAINFVLKQGEVQRTNLRKISHDVARQSALHSAQQKGQTLDEMVEVFKDRLDYFLADNATPELRLPLKMVFTFYCDPNTRTSLQFRMDL